MPLLVRCEGPILADMQRLQVIPLTSFAVRKQADGKDILLFSEKKDILSECNPTNLMLTTARAF